MSHNALAQSLSTADPASWRTPEYKADWGLEAMHAANAYAAGYTGLGVTVGVVDSGVYSAHPEFADGRVKPLTITGTFGSDGFYFMDGSGKPQNQSPQPSFFKAGDSYTAPGTYSPIYNDPHGTHVTGTIGASRDGVGMQGVAFNANVYVTNTQTNDSARYGTNVDYAYFKNAYGSLAAAGARVINSSWGSPPTGDNYNTIQGLRTAYSKFSGKLSYVDALSETTKQYNIIQVFAAGNTGYSNPNVRSSLPYFRPDLESNWLAVGAAAKGGNGGLNPGDLVLASYSNRAGVAKYWYVVAPGSAINSTVPTYAPGARWNLGEWAINPNKQTGYTTVNGTSMAAPHATGALALIMERFPYMTNQQARDVLLTTAYHRNVVAGVADANPNAPNAVWGWGVIDLNKAMNGPGQFLGSVAANLPAGTRDTWSNNISEDALIQRKQENDAAAAAWAARKAAHDPTLTPEWQTEIQVETTRVAAFADVPTRGSLIKAGDGILTLTGTNSYSGGTTFAGGILSVARDANLGAAAGGLTFDGGILQVTGTSFTTTGRAITWGNGGGGFDIASLDNTFTLNQSLSGTGGLAKLGAGTLVFTATHSFTGQATLAGGGLQLTETASLIAPVVTLAGTTLTNAGTLAGGVTNAGTLITTGTIAGGLSNTGFVQAAGVLAGTVSNASGAAVALTGSTTGITRLSNNGAIDLGGTALTVGSLTGTTATAVIGNGQLTVGTDGSSASYAGQIVDGASRTSLTKAGAGTLTLTGNNSYTGLTTVTGGLLSVNGAFSSTLAIGTSGTLRGSGTLSGPLVVAGRLAPGNSPGTLTVNGPVTLASTSTFQTDIDGTGTGTGAGNYSHLVTTGTNGTVTVAGTLAPTLRGITGSATNSYTPPLGTSFTVIQSSAGLSGSFAGLAQPASGLPASTRFDVLYGPTSLALVVTPLWYGNLAANGLATTANASALGSAVDSIRPVAGIALTGANAGLFNSLYSLAPTALAAALSQMTGEVYASTAAQTFDDARQVRAAINERLDDATGPKPDKATAKLSSSLNVAVWATGYGGWGNASGDGLASLGWTQSGFIAGADVKVFDTTRLGIAAGFGQSDGHVDSLNSKADNSHTDLALYGVSQRRLRHLLQRPG